MPLDEFVRRGVQPSLAMRALSETSILVKQAPNGHRHAHSRLQWHPDGRHCGRSALLAGFDLAGFSVQDAEDH